MAAVIISGHKSSQRSLHGDVDIGLSVALSLTMISTVTDYVDAAKVLWSREKDIRGDFFGRMSYNILKAWPENDGFPVAGQHRISSTNVRALSSAGADAIPSIQATI